MSDPKVKFALQNFPIDGFSYTREGMTQVVAGISQSFPKGKTLKYKSEKTGFKADIERVRFQSQKVNIVLVVRKTWLDIYYLKQSLNTVFESKKLLKKIIEATESAYGTGRQNIQDIIGAELELSVLEDRQIDINRQIEIAKAELGKWIGVDNSKREISKKFPKFKDLQSYQIIQNNLKNHPLIKITDAVIDVENSGVNIAQEQYKPSFNVGFNYGLRGGNLSNGDSRSDFATAMVTIDMPLFTKKRQDKNLSASKLKLTSATFKRDDVLRDLNVMLAREYANWQKLGGRAAHYKTNVTQRAEENFEASLNAYQDDLTDFSSLMRSQVMVLDTKLQAMKLRVDQAKSKAVLLYLQGDKS